MKTEQVLERLEKLFKLGKEIEGTVWDRHIGSSTYKMVDVGRMSAFRSGGLSFIIQFYNRKHPHFIEFESRTKETYLKNLAAGVGILLMIKDEIENGWLTTYKGIVSAEIFSDFIEMAEHLLEQGYKDPAAVVLGSVLEEHLRQLSMKHGVTIQFSNKAGKLKPKKADTLNAELVKADVYNLIDQKSVTFWLGLRNNAAHGNYAEYTKEQVVLMRDGILDFLRRNQL